ncbi:hypothetical protein PIB30_018712 [Stylosanthes scabra]|uniref:Uncharacterized protein n=1 Tax=Stylosanthes scabra TaxID=79078 RepID=A0ABU6X9I7_9FABA|nr:hypothetical protein [Stylosanthes scabra]
MNLGPKTINDAHASPPPLLAAVFQWNRGGDGEEQSRGGLQQLAEGSDRDEKTFVTMTQPWSLAERCLSLSSSRNGTNGGKEGTATAAGTQAQASDGWCGPMPAMVESAAAQGWWKHEVDGNWVLSAQKELLQNGGEKDLPPILGLGFNWSYSIQAQNKEDHNAFSVGVQIFF